MENRIQPFQKYSHIISVDGSAKSVRLRTFVVRVTKKNYIVAVFLYKLNVEQWKLAVITIIPPEYVENILSLTIIIYRLKRLIEYDRLWHRGWSTS